jgi:ABC-type branched-subunit amino acid transport system substrate-binding protein
MPFSACISFAAWLRRRAGAVVALGVLVCIALGVLVCTVPAAHAQQAEIPQNPDAALVFEQGVAAFERGAYSVANQRFELVNEYPLNQKTTAALLMSGKALYRMERYRDAIRRLQTLLERYPQTSYRTEANRVIEAARDALQTVGARPDTLRLGIALPMRDQDAALTQALFNSIRLAVERHNGVRRRYVLPRRLQSRVDTFDVYQTATLFSDSLAQADGRTTLVTPTDTLQLDSLQVITERVRSPGWVAKMHFRQTSARAEDARAAIDSLVRIDRVDVIIGPLYSTEARAAGEVAERSRVVMVAPLATDASVSEGRDHVFQANPTIEMRGRAVARFASRSLLKNEAGIIHEATDDIAARMAAGFREEARTLGLRVPYTLRLETRRAWSRLPEAFAADSTVTDSVRAATDVAFLPVSGRNAKGKIQDALIGLTRYRNPPRVLGNSQWHDLPVPQEASKVLATYSNDFYVQTERPEVQSFIRRYRLLTGQTPDALSATAQRLAYTGYDVARFLLAAVEPGATRPAPAALRQPSVYNGLGMRIDFQSGNVNEAMYFLRYRNNRFELLR